MRNKWRLSNIDAYNHAGQHRRMEVRYFTVIPPFGVGTRTPVKYGGVIFARNAKNDAHLNGQRHITENRFQNYRKPVLGYRGFANWIFLLEFSYFSAGTLLISQAACAAANMYQPASPSALEAVAMPKQHVSVAAEEDGTIEVSHAAQSHQRNW